MKKALKDAIKRHHDIRGYRLQFMVITKSAELQRKYKGKSNKGYSCPRDISFNAKEDILDFVTLIDRVNMLSECEQDQKNYATARTIDGVQFRVVRLRRCGEKEIFFKN